MLADPVPALFWGLELPIATKSTDHCEVMLPTICKVVKESRRVPRFEETALHNIKVSEVQSVNSELVKANLSITVCKIFPKPIPKTETVTDPVLGRFAR